MWIDGLVIVSEYKRTESYSSGLKPQDWTIVGGTKINNREPPEEKAQHNL